VIKNSTRQGVLIQSSRNILQGNAIIDSQQQAVYVVNANSASSPTPSVANENQILQNKIYHSRIGSGNSIGIQVVSSNNVIHDNQVMKQLGPQPIKIDSNKGNQHNNNRLLLQIDKSDAKNWAAKRGAVHQNQP